MELDELEKKYRAGVSLLKERDYYSRLIDEIQLSIKYIDNQFFLEIFSENLVSDLRGIFSSFVRQDLRKIAQEMDGNSGISMNDFINREYMNLTILKKCTTNLRYQVKSLVRMPEVKELEFKSSFFQAVSRKLNGEIQEIYRILSQNYKHYFREQFSGPAKEEDKISIACIESLSQNFNEHFIRVVNRFYQLYDAIKFTRALFRLELEAEIRNRIATIFFERQDRMEKVLDYFVNDLKTNFIRTMDRHRRSGRNLEWIQSGFESFLSNPRFVDLSRKVISQTLAVIRKEKQSVSQQDIF